MTPDNRPYVGDYVGQHNETGVHLYICAVDYRDRLVKIAELACSTSDWLDETQARAYFGYEWGAHKTLPWYSAAMQIEQGLDSTPGKGGPG